MKESPKEKTNCRSKNSPQVREDSTGTKEDNHKDGREPDSMKSSNSFPPTRPHLHSKKVSPVKDTQPGKLPEKATEVNTTSNTIRKSGFRSNRRKINSAQQSEGPITRKSRHSHCLIPKELLPPLIRSIAPPQNKSDAKSSHGVVSSPRRSGGDQRHETRFGVDKNRISQKVLSRCRKITTSVTTEPSSCNPQHNEKRDRLSKESTKLVPLHLERSFGDSKSKSVSLSTSVGKFSNEGLTTDLSTSGSEPIKTKKRLSRENIKLEPLQLNKSNEDFTAKSVALSQSKTDDPRTSNFLSKSFDDSKSDTVIKNVSCNILRSTDKIADMQLNEMEKENPAYLQLTAANQSYQVPCPVMETVNQVCPAPLMLEHVKYVPSMDLASDSSKAVPTPQEYLIEGKSIPSLSRNKSPLYSRLEDLGKQKNSETPISSKKYARSFFLEPLPAEVGRDSNILNRNETNLNKLSVLGVGVLQTLGQEGKEIKQPPKEGKVGLSSPETSPQKTTSDNGKSPSSPLKDLYKFACKGVKFNLEGERIHTVVDESAPKQQRVCKPGGYSQNDGNFDQIKFADKHSYNSKQNTICPQDVLTGEDELNVTVDISSAAISEAERLTNEKPEKSTHVKSTKEIFDMAAEACTFERIDEEVCSSEVGKEKKTGAKKETRVLQEDGDIFVHPHVVDTDVFASSPLYERENENDGNNTTALWVDSFSKMLALNDSSDPNSVSQTITGSHLYQNENTTTKSNDKVSDNPKTLLSDSPEQSLQVNNEDENGVAKYFHQSEGVDTFQTRSEHVSLPYDKENKAGDITEESISSPNLTGEKANWYGSLSATRKGVLEYEYDGGPMQDSADHEKEYYVTLEECDEELECNGNLERKEINLGKMMLETKETSALSEATGMVHSFRDENLNSIALNGSLSSLDDSLDENMVKDFSDNVCFKTINSSDQTFGGHVDATLDSTSDALEPPILRPDNTEVIDLKETKAASKGNHSINRSTRKHNILPVILERGDKSVARVKNMDFYAVQNFPEDNIEEHFNHYAALQRGSVSSYRMEVNLNNIRDSESFVEEISRPSNMGDEAFSRACQNIWMAKSMGDLIQRKATLILNRLYLKMEGVGYCEDTTTPCHEPFLDSEEARKLEIETERFIRGLNTIFMTFHQIWVAENDFIRSCDEELRKNAGNAVLSPAIIENLQK